MVHPEIPSTTGNGRACRHLPSTEASVARRAESVERARRFGPNLNPLFYTALRTTPRQLRWENLYPDAPVTIGLYVLTDREALHPLLRTGLPPGTSACLLPDMQVEPGRVCIWRVVFDAPDEPVTWEGRFWMLDRHQLARWERGRRVLLESGDPDFAAIGMALFLSDLQLYQEALQCVLRGPAQSRRPARALLACTAQALIYQQMHQRMQAVQQVGDIAPETLPRFACWAEQRARYYRERAIHRTSAGTALAGQPRGSQPLEACAA